MMNNRTEFASEAIRNKAWWSPVFDGYHTWMHIAITKRHMTLEDIIAYGTEEWLTRYAESMDEPQFTVDEWREFATGWYNELTQRGLV